MQKSDFIEKPVNKMSLGKRKKVFGVGINNAEYRVYDLSLDKTKTCPYYKVWAHMIMRCYDPKYLSKKPAYIGCSVCPEWIYFMNFRSWMMEQEEWKGLVLDKDIFNPKNKVYSPENCCFVTHALNILVINRTKGRGNYSCGVSYNKKGDFYYAQCMVKGNLVTIGKATSELEASMMYKKFKSNLMIEESKLQGDIRIKKGLLLHADYLLNN